MGITIREMIEAEYFQDFKVIAGAGGIDKQIQGVAILDAPDGFRWTRGRELVLSSGYLFRQNAKFFEDFIESEAIQKISGFGIKADRYLEEIPMKVIKAFEQHQVPLMMIPSEPSWMEVMNQLNVLVMNKSIKRFGIGWINPKSYSNLTYQSRKIDKILSQIEGEMHFPAMLYDLTKEKAYYSSPGFIDLSKELRTEDFWKPEFEHTTEVLCDNLRMVRYRFTDLRYERPYSWITIPITVSGSIKAYFVVVEATELIDYFDQFALRIGFLLIQSLYEQILVAQSLEDIGFEKFMKDLQEGSLTTEKAIIQRGEELGITATEEHFFVLMEKEKEMEAEFSDEDAEIIKTVAGNVLGPVDGRIGGMNPKQWGILVPMNQKFSAEANHRQLHRVLGEFDERLTKKLGKVLLQYAVVDIPGDITGLPRNIQRGRKALQIAPIIEKK